MIKIRIHVEFCCDFCNEPIHNHIECPSCKDPNAGTDAYCDLLEERLGFIMRCEECGADFKLLSKEGYLNDWKWEQIN